MLTVLLDKDNVQFDRNFHFIYDILISIYISVIKYTFHLWHSDFIYDILISSALSEQFQE